MEYLDRSQVYNHIYCYHSETIAILPSSSQAGIIYYSKEKYFRHVQEAAAVGLEKFNNDPVLQFFKAYGVLREGEDPSALPPNLRH